MVYSAHFSAFIFFRVVSAQSQSCYGNTLFSLFNRECGIFLFFW